jgi:hypothetical protein
MLRRNRSKPLKPVNSWKGPKPKLEMKVTQTCRVHFKALQEYLTLVYKMRGYDIRRSTGARGYMTPEFNVTGCLPDTPNLWQQVDSVRRGHKERNLGLILDVLCNDGFIQPGKYIIDMKPGIDPLDEYRDALHKTGDPFDVVCMTLKRENQHDRVFMKQAALLDKKVIEYKTKLRGGISE